MKREERPSDFQELPHPAPPCGGRAASMAMATNTRGTMISNAVAMISTA